MRQLSLNDARTLAVQKRHQRAVKIARQFRTGRVRSAHRALVLAMAQRLLRELGR